MNICSTFVAPKKRHFLKAKQAFLPNLKSQHISDQQLTYHMSQRTTSTKTRIKTIIQLFLRWFLVSENHFH
ncbi:MAG: hypothetical protein RIS47_1213 [Bacteroidota bacterium]